MKLKVDADLSKVKARPRVYSPAKTAWLDELFVRTNGMYHHISFHQVRGEML